MELVVVRPIESFLGTIGKHTVAVLYGAYPFVTRGVIHAQLIPWLKNRKTQLLLVCNLSPFVVATSFVDPTKLLVDLMDALGDRVVIRSHSRLHAKAFIADDRVAVFGSSNLTSGGEVVHDSPVVAEIVRFIAGAVLNVRSVVTFSSQEIALMNNVRDLEIAVRLLSNLRRLMTRCQDRIRDHLCTLDPDARPDISVEDSEHGIGRYFDNGNVYVGLSFGKGEHAWSMAFHMSKFIAPTDDTILRTQDDEYLYHKIGKYALTDEGPDDEFVTEVCRILDLWYRSRQQTLRRSLLG